MFDADKMDRKACMSLCMAVVEKACSDYIAMKKGLARTGDKARYENKLNLLRRWFLSDAFELWSCGVDGHALLERLDAKAETVRRPYIKKEG